MEVLIIKQKLRAAGRCIYCGTTDGLTLEHIIPFGLWGRIEFPDASCRNCAEKINVFERQIQQDQLGGLRQRAGVPKRKRRRRDYKFRLTFGSVDGGPPPAEPIEISGTEIPKSLLLVRLLPPQILVGAWHREPQFFFYQEPPDEQIEFMEKYPFSAHFGGTYNHHHWCRLIAKIGHGLTVAYTPPDILSTFKLLLPDLILNGTDNYHHLIGGDDKIPPPSKMLHEFGVANAVRGETEFLFVKLRLFANLGAPIYHAVVASRPLGETTVTRQPSRLP